MNERLRKALDATFEKFRAMSDEELAKRLDEHAEGDIAVMMRETGAAQMFLDEMRARRAPEAERPEGTGTNIYLQEIEYLTARARAAEEDLERVRAVVMEIRKAADAVDILDPGSYYRAIDVIEGLAGAAHPTQGEERT